jgi:hypothetical protein
MVKRDDRLPNARPAIVTLLAPFASLPVLLACALPVALAPAVPVAVGRLQNAIYNVHAQDPAGHFTVTVMGDHVIAATIAGEPVAGALLRQVADQLHFLNPDGSTDFTIQVKSTGIHWSPRSPVRSRLAPSRHSTRAAAPG